mmetsp:Transcript_20927/g.32211  ORF Transcript_20927/g.32211 Transcript_20927/m.32211 type:complete len:216 (-) Transcript_20927:1000-1647(-)
MFSLVRSCQSLQRTVAVVATKATTARSASRLHVVVTTSSHSYSTTLPCRKGDEEKETSLAYQNYQLNCSKALMKADEGRLFSDIQYDSVSTLEGIGPEKTTALEQLNLPTIDKMATSKFYHIAKAIQVMATTAEIQGDRPSLSIMNIDQALDKDYETQSFQVVLEAPVSALQGITDEKAETLWKTLGVHTVKDLANLKYFHWAESIVTLGKYEGK